MYISYCYEKWRIYMSNPGSTGGLSLVFNAPNETIAVAKMYEQFNRNQLSDLHIDSVERYNLVYMSPQESCPPIHSWCIHG